MDMNILSIFYWKPKLGSIITKNKISLDLLENVYTSATWKVSK